MKLSTARKNRKLRVFTGCLIGAVGIALIASLWLRKLTGIALGDALLGVVYLIIAIGVFGQSRFSLFLAAIVPAAVAIGVYLSLNNERLATVTDSYDIARLRIAADMIIAISAALAFWRARKLPRI